MPDRPRLLDPLKVLVIAAALCALAAATYRAAVSRATERAWSEIGRAVPHDPDTPEHPEDAR